MTIGVNGGSHKALGVVDQAVAAAQRTDRSHLPEGRITDRGRRITERIEHPCFLPRRIPRERGSISEDIDCQVSMDDPRLSVN